MDNQGNENTTGKSMHSRFGLGQLDEEMSAGYLQIHAHEPAAAVFTPDMLQVVTDTNMVEVIRETDLTPRQVKTDHLLVDIVATSGAQYEIRYYHASQISGAKAGSPAVYPLWGNAYKTYVISRPEANDNNVRITEKDDTATVKTVTQFVYDGTDTWDLYEGMDTSTPTLGSALRRSSTQIVVAGDTRTETRKVMTAGGTVLSQVEEMYTQYPFGWAMTKMVVDPTTTKLTETWEYYTAPGVDGYGKVKTYVSETGYWEHYIYDSSNVLSKTIQQLDDNEHDPDDVPQMEADNVVIAYTEVSGTKTIDSAAEELLVSKTTTSSQGAVKQVSYEVYRSDSEVDPTNLDEVWHIRSFSTDPENGHADTLTFIAAYMNDVLDNGVVNDTEDKEHLLTRTWRYKAGEDDEFELARSLSPDGTVTIYDYGTANTTIVQRGFVDDALAATPTMEYGTRTTTVVDSQGNMQSTYVERAVKGFNSDDYFAVSYTEYLSSATIGGSAYTDPFGRPVQVNYYFGIHALNKKNSTGSPVAAYFTQRTYSGGSCGCSGDGDSYDTYDRYGVKTTHYMDRLGRVYMTDSAVGTSAAMTQISVLDALGRAVDRGIDGDLDNDIERVDNDDLVTSVTYDAAGRMTSSKDPEGRMSYMTYRRVKADGIEYNFGTDTGPFYWETRQYGHNDDVPVQVVWADSHGRTVVAFSVDLTWSGTPTGAESFVANSELTRSTSVYDWAGRVTESRSYFDLTGLSISLSSVGTEGTNYLVTGEAEYDALGRGFRRTDAAGNITEMVYESGTGRTVGMKAGLSVGSLSVVSRQFYKLFEGGDDADDPTGDPRPWVTRSYTVKPSLASAPTEDTSMSHYVYVDNVETISVSGGALTGITRTTQPQYGPWTQSVQDDQGRATVQYALKNGGGGNPYLGATVTTYDSDGRVQHVDQYGATGGSIDAGKIRTSYFYDDAGRSVKVETVGRGYTKTVYDVYGRVLLEVFCSDEGSDTDYVDGTPNEVVFIDDIVLAETEYTYDKSGLVLQIKSNERTHDATATGLLSSAGASQKRVTYAYRWYDANGRSTHSATVGTDSTYTYVAGTPTQPNTSDNILVSKVEYDDAGRAYLTTDNRGQQTRTYFDAMGRVTHVIENYKIANMSSADNPESVTARDPDINRVTKRVYDNRDFAGGVLKELVAFDPAADGTGSAGDDQVTHYIYSGELDAAKRGYVPVNGRPVATLMPDAVEDGETRSGAITKINNATSGGDFTYTEFYADGSVYRTTDPRGVQWTTEYTSQGYVANRHVSSAGGWTAVGDQRIKYTYGDAGELDTVTTYSTATESANDRTSFIDYTYDGFYNVTIEEQDHDPTANSGAGVGETIQWSFDTTVDGNDIYTKAYRLNTITYPNGRVLQLDYSGNSGIDDKIGRPSAIEEDATGNDIVAYTYLGGGRMVRKDYPGPDVRLDFIDEAAGEGSDANNDYELSLDRFGRPIRYQWERYTPGTPDTGDEDIIHIAHGYDRNSNRLYDDRQVYALHSKVFDWDGLDRIVGRQEGVIGFPSGVPTIGSHWTRDARDWTLDQLGNAKRVDTAFDSNDRYGVTVNDANEITAFHTDPTHSPQERVEHFDLASDEDVFVEQLDASDGSPLAAGDVTVAGSLLVVGTAADEDNPVVLIAAPEMGPHPFMTRLKVASLPTGGARGLVGYVFGYQSDTDFWVYGKNMANNGSSAEDGDFELYHMRDHDSSGSIDFGDPDERKFIARVSIADAAADTLYPLYGWTGSHTAMNAYSAMALAGGFPAGRVGLYTEVANTSFDYFRHAPITPAYPIGSRWESASTQNVIDAGSGNGKLVSSGSIGEQTVPVLLRNVRASRFEVTLALTRNNGDPSAAPYFVFSYEDPDNYTRITLSHNPTQTAPLGYVVQNGGTRITPTATPTPANVYAPTSHDDEVWYRVVSDGSTLTVYSSSTEGGLASASACYQSANYPLAIGQIGFCGGSYNAYFDNITVKTDPDNNGTYDKTEVVETFTLNGSDQTEDDFEYDAAGNLTFNGHQVLTYDAMNRLVKVQVGSPDGDDGDTDPDTGSTLAEYRYDGLGRRILETSYTGDGEDTVLNQYYTGWSVVETRDNYSGGQRVLTQYVWDNLAGHYVDSLAQVGHNINMDPAWVGDQEVEAMFYAAQDQQFNLLALLTAKGDVAERYEYTLYGQRLVFRPSDVDLPNLLPGDFDYDGDSDDFDFGVWISNYTGSLSYGVGGKSHAQGDADGDGDVDNDDYDKAIDGKYTGSRSNLSVVDPKALAPAHRSATLSVSGVPLCDTGFTGKKHDDATCLIYFPARSYDPVTGRFLQHDPSGYPDGLNGYAAYNVIWGVVDPMGTDAAGPDAKFVYFHIFIETANRHPRFNMEAVEGKFRRHFIDKMNMVGLFKDGSSGFHFIFNMFDTTGVPENLGWSSLMRGWGGDSEWREGLREYACSYRYRGYVKFSDNNFPAVASTDDGKKTAIYKKFLDSSVQTWQHNNPRDTVNWDNIFFNIIAHEQMYLGASGGWLDGIPIVEFFTGAIDNPFEDKGDIGSAEGNGNDLPRGLTDFNQDFVETLFWKTHDARTSN